jgi:hypothetical protein
VGKINSACSLADLVEKPQRKLLLQAQWARLVVLATVGAALYVAVSMVVQRPLLKDITGAFFFREARRN